MAKTSDKTKNAWNARNYDQVLLSVRKGEKERLKTTAAENGVSVSRLVIDSVNMRFPGLLSVLDDESKKKKQAEEPINNQDREESPGL